MRPILTAALILLLGLGAATAQAPGQVYRVGAIGLGARTDELIRGFTVPELARLGFVEGRNLLLQTHIGPVERLPALATGLMASKPDLIFAIGNPAVAAAKAATGTVPIVIIGADPVELGFAATLARPGGNITGVSILAGELDGKRLQLLHDVAPSPRPLAVLFHAAIVRESSLREMRTYAAGAGLELLVFEVASAAEYKAAFAAIGAAGAQSLMIAAAPQFNNDAAILAQLAIDAGLRTACHWPENAEQGCLLAYGPSLGGFYRLSANYIARVLKGAVPGELPIEGPTHFQLALNLKTARALGLELPPALLARADAVIE